MGFGGRKASEKGFSQRGEGVLRSQQHMLPESMTSFISALARERTKFLNFSRLKLLQELHVRIKILGCSRMQALSKIGQRTERGAMHQVSVRDPGVGS